MKKILVAILLLISHTAFAHNATLDKYGCRYAADGRSYFCQEGLLAGQVFANQDDMLQALQLLVQDIKRASKPGANIKQSADPFKGLQ
jgi:hypothetical protein